LKPLLAKPATAVLIGRGIRSPNLGTILDAVGVAQPHSRSQTVVVPRHPHRGSHLHAPPAMPLNGCAPRCHLRRQSHCHRQCHLSCRLSTCTAVPAPPVPLAPPVPICPAACARAAAAARAAPVPMLAACAWLPPVPMLAPTTCLPPAPALATSYRCRHLLRPRRPHRSLHSRRTPSATAHLRLPTRPLRYSAGGCTSRQRPPHRRRWLHPTTSYLPRPTPPRWPHFPPPPHCRAGCPPRSWPRNAL